jgi:Na+-driven multidrug efflux pump
MIPALFMICQNNATARFLNAMRYSIVPLVGSIIATCTHILWLYLFVTVLDLKLYGVGLASLFTWTITHIICLVYIYYVKEVSEAVFWPTLNVFSHWGEYFKIACPCIMLGIPEWWANSSLVFMAGYLGVSEQAAVTAVYGICTNYWCLFYGLMVGTCILVGNKMGANKPDRALYYIKLTAKISSLFIFIMILILFFARRGIASLYFSEVNDDDSEVYALTVSCIAVLSLIIISDSL